MKKILDEIVLVKKAEVEKRKIAVPEKELIHRPLFRREVTSLADSILHPEKTGIIAEFKRRSPSKGIINGDASVVETTMGYEKYGASGVSVLTDTPYFGGTDEDLISARNKISIPLLRKDFVVDPYQVSEARSLGADVILLIAAVLTKQEIHELTSVAHDLGMEVLLELHAEEEFEKIPSTIRLVGINNRNLQSFDVSVSHSIDLASKLPASCIKIAESGIDSPETLIELKKNGFDGFLIGERFMKETDPASAFKRFTESVRNILSQRKS